MAHDNHDDKHKDKKDHHSMGHSAEGGHYILPTKLILTVGAALMVCTVITVWIAGIDLGRFNFLIAMVVATVKALLVALFFMNLRKDDTANGVIFGTSFIFLAIFIVLTSTDLFFRGDVYVKPGELEARNASQGSKLKDAWISTPELIAHGKEVFQQNCVSCHGAEGYGNGVSASSYNPPPRNFHQDAGWKNGRSVAMVFKTLKEGIGPQYNMASWKNLPVDDRWALDQYVLSLGPDAPKPSTAQDFAQAGVDISKPDGGLSGAPAEKSIPVELAMERMAMAEPAFAQNTYQNSDSSPSMNDAETEVAHSGKGIYRAYCLQCHGMQGEGMRWKNMGVNPKAFVQTMPFAQADGVKSADAFNHIVINGIEGDLMPGFGQLSSSDLSALYGYVRELAAHR
jgi:caa(3)-type oxidase subunit IV